jgi:group I intron endonuclease
LIEREQYYLDLLKPEYNICKIAGSTLGFKHSELTKAKMSINNTGKKHTYETRIKIGQSLQHKKSNNIPRVIKPHTKLELSLRCQGVRVEVYDKSNNLIKLFPTIASAAKYFNISSTTLVSTLKTGISYDGNFILKSEIKDIRVLVYSNDHKLLNVFDNVLKASI